MDSDQKNCQVNTGTAKKGKWVVPISKMADNTVNPIRRIVDHMKIEPNPSYDFISVSIGMLSFVFISINYFPGCDDYRL